MAQGRAGVAARGERRRRVGHAAIVPVAVAWALSACSASSQRTVMASVHDDGGQAGQGEGDAGPTFYVSASQGSDDGPGTKERPWKTLAKLASTPFAPGSAIYLRRGDRWEESLEVSSSGRADAPIVYDAYGSGEAPVLVGSDALPSGWSPGPVPNTWTLERAVANCVTEDDVLLRSTALLVQDASDRARNLATLSATPGSFFADGAQVHVNVPDDPRSNGRRYRACARENLLLVRAKSFVTVRNLSLQDSARADGGYAALVEGGDHVTLEDVVARRAGKHHVAAIETDAFVGRRLRGMEALADQGWGGATTFVHYGGHEETSFRSAWIDCEAFAGDQPYPSFITHGPGVSEVHLDGLMSHGYGPVIMVGKPDAEVRVRGGLLDGGRLDVDAGENVVIDGLAMVGMAMIEVWGGKNTIIENVVLSQGTSNWEAGWPGAILTAATGTKVLFNTLVTGGAGSGGIAVDSTKAQGTVVVGNVVVGAASFIRQVATVPVVLDVVSDGNLVSVAAAYSQYGAPELGAAPWTAMGHDTGSFFGPATFVASMQGDFRLCQGAPGAAVSASSVALSAIPTDARRPSAGAFAPGAVGGGPCATARPAP